MKEIKEELKILSGAVCAGAVRDAADEAARMLGRYAEVRRSDKNATVTAFLKGERDYTVLLDAHIDEVSLTVTDVDEEGFVTAAKCGGIDIRTLPASRVIIHGREKVAGVFCSTPPHLSSGETEYNDISKIKIDTALGEKAKEIISEGDMITYDVLPAELLNDKVTGKSLDDRAGIVCLTELARRLSGKKLPVSVAFAAVDAEELGLRGARTAAYKVSPDEAIAIDVSFCVCPDVSETEGGVMGNGAMIGLSPVLDGEISRKLIKTAKENKIPYQKEVMGGRTSTDADVISLTKGGVKTGLVSIPLKNMHTAAEIVDVKDIVSVCDIIEKYILSGGALND